TAAARRDERRPPEVAMSVERLGELASGAAAEALSAAAHAAVSTSRVAFIGELRAEEDELARGDLAHDEGVQVELEPLCESAGTSLVAAQVVGARLAALSASPASREWDPSRPVAHEPEQVTVEVRSPDDGRARASVHFAGGPLGPLHVDLELKGNALTLTAHV